MLQCKTLCDTACPGLDTDSPGHATLCYKLGDNTGQGLWQLTFIPTKSDSNDMYEKIKEENTWPTLWDDMWQD